MGAGEPDPSSGGVTAGIKGGAGAFVSPLDSSGSCMGPSPAGGEFSSGRDGFVASGALVTSTTCSGGIGPDSSSTEVVGEEVTSGSFGPGPTITGASD